MAGKLHLEELAYTRDSGDLFERVRDLPGAALLDSSFPHSTAGRYDILTACPVEDGLPVLPLAPDEASARRWFTELALFRRARFGAVTPVSQDVPFCGGLLGYLEYGIGRPLQKLAGSGKGNGIRAYDWCVVQDHLLKRAVFVAQPAIPAALRADLLARLRQPRAAPRQGDFHLGESFRANFSEQSYRAAFDRVQSYIHAGDCYQVNLAQRFSSRYQGDPWGAYRLLRPLAAAPFAAFLATGEERAVISLSPERFLSLHGRHVETAPIKGTRPRHADEREDRNAARELRNSAKDRAENLMIVDLLRNDLGRNCVPGSIHVDRLFEIQSFANVHHMVSTISGELRPDRSAEELLRDSFPGGSITGAPKRRAMEVISELEPDERQVYCGSILYISADGRMDSNIAIRTLLCQEGEIHCWGGGGIVADSRWRQEYQETFDKIGGFLAALEAGRD